MCLTVLLRSVIKRGNNINYTRLNSASMTIHSKILPFENELKIHFPLNPQKKRYQRHLVGSVFEDKPSEIVYFQ